MRQKLGHANRIQCRANLRLSLCLMLACLIVRTGTLDAQPLTLTYSEAVRMALEANLELRSVEFEEAVARARLLQARQRAPVSVGFDGEDYLDLFTGHHGASLEPTLSILAEQDLGVFGQRRRRTQASEAGLLRVQSEIYDARRRISMQTGEVYFTFLLARANLAAAENALTHLQGITTVVESRVREGESAGLELMRLQMEFLKFEDEVHHFALTLEQSQTNLLTILGHADLSAPIHPTDSLTPAPLMANDGTPIASIDGVLVSDEILVAQAIVARPDLLALEYAATEAHALMAIQRGLLRPSTSVSFGRRHHAHEAGTEFSFAVSLPLLWGRNLGGVREAEALYQQIVARQAHARIKVQNELHLAVQAVNTHSERFRGIDVNYREGLENLHEGIHASYELGDATLSDLLDVHRTALEINLLRNSVLFGYRTSLIALATALHVLPV